ncbi:MAG: hypothetical protein MRZ79_11635 [Bacteroidia bacterium]|nr:hypothetical protein [Bacteroidia bacterium]
MKNIILSILILLGLSFHHAYAGQAAPLMHNHGIKEFQGNAPLKAEKKKGFKPFNKIKKGIQKARKSVFFSRLSVICSGLSILSSLTMTTIEALILFGGGFLVLAMIFFGIAVYYFIKEKKEGVYSP